MRSFVLAGLAMVSLAALTSLTATPAQAQTCAYTGGAATMAVPGRPFAAEPSVDGCWLFVSMLSPEGPNRKGGGLAVLHNEAGRFVMIRKVPLAGGPAGLALSHDGKTLVVAAEDDVAILDVSKLEDAAADPVVSIVPEEPDAGVVYVALSRDDRLLFLSEEHQMRIRVLDLAAARRDPVKAQIGAIAQGRSPVGLVLSSDGARLYATSEVAPAAGAFPSRCEPPPGSGRRGREAEGLLSVIDVAAAATTPSKAVIAVRPAGCQPVRVALSPDGATVWVTARGDDRLEGFAAAKLAGASLAPPEISTKVGDAPVGIAARPDGAQVWVADSDRFARNGQGSLTAVSSTGQVLKTVPCGVFPRDLRFLPDGKTLVAAEFGSRDIRLVPTDGI